mmetsp:Transcript_5119/g.7203  ORF Transcript_5119/g.7203 Transcript_5119/m.7203 type:complete len:207 (-) Transcript_5119:343-963(-)
MLQISATPFKQTSLFKFLLVFGIKNFFHGGPESFLPLEDCLFCHNVRCNVGIKTTLEEQVSELSDIVIGVVINDAYIVVVRQITFVDDKGCRSVSWQVGCQKSSLANLVPTGSVFTTDGMAFKKYGIFVSQFNSFNMNCVATNGNTVPSTTHGTIGRAKGLTQTHFLYLNCCWGNSWFLEDGSNTSSSCDSIMQNFIIGFIAGFAR